MTEYLFTVKDPLGQEVILTENCYNLHILLEHPDLPDVNQIAEAIKSPDLIAQDAIDLQRMIYY